MLVRGFSGGHDLINERHCDLGKAFWHDSAAALREDGNVLFAIEEERLNRIKHTNKLPTQAIRACLASRNIRLSDIDIFAYYEEDLQRWLRMSLFEKPREAPSLDANIFLRDCFRRGFGEEVDAKKFRLVHHHYAHAMSAFALTFWFAELV